MQTLERTEERIQVPEAEAAMKPIRRHDLDWLRVLAVLLLIPFHSARVFDVFDDFYVKSSHTSEGLSWGIVAFLDPWHMPLLFVLAGAATWYALGHRSAGAYAGERTKRLLVPFLFGLFVIVPPQTYLAQWSKGIEPTKGFWDFSGDLTGYTGGFTPAHLWFIAFLFGFSFLALPLFVRWRRRPIGARWLLFAMPALLFLANELPAVEDGNQSPWYSIALFIGGFLLVADPRAERLIHRAWKPLLATAIATMTTLMLVWHSGGPGFAEGSVAEAAWALFELVNVWVWVLALLGGGHAFLNRENGVLRYANSAAYPFYLLHQTVIVAVAYVVVRWEVGAIVQFGTIVVASFAISLGLYEIAVRRTNATRFLFGMKPRPRPQAPIGR